jgi:hypothetical protein
MIEFSNETLEQRREILKEQLASGIAEVTFTKVDGTLRTMPCTLDATLLPPAPVHVSNTDNPVDFPKVKKVNPAVMGVYVTDKGEWRSFRVENVISVRAL